MKYIRLANSSKNFILSFSYAITFGLGAALFLSLSYIVIALIFLLAVSFEPSKESTKWLLFLYLKYVLIIACPLAFLGTLMVHLGVLLFPKPDAGFGIRISYEDCPDLFSLLVEVARDLDVDLFDRVYILPDATAAVLETTTISSLRRQRNLLIGWALIRCLSQQQLKAIIAHELAHFNNNALQLQRSIYIRRLTIKNTLDMIAAWENMANIFSRMRKDETMGCFDPLTRVFHWSFELCLASLAPYKFWCQIFLHYFDRVGKKFSHEAEFYCDTVSATKYGANTLLDALCLLVSTQLALQKLFDLTINQRTKNPNIYPQLPILVKEIGAQLDTIKLSELMPETHSHPSYHDRAISLLTAHIMQDNSTPLVSTYNYYVNFERQLTAHFYRLSLSRAEKNSSLD